MFGDPLSENSYYKKISILDACDNITGGGTPSKKHPEYYEGNIPWVSPKDMNTSIIEDSQDHITEEAITKSTTKLIPEQSVLMVIRSGVLKHDLPIAINKVPVTINQDMKAFLVGSKIIPQYLFGYFKTIEADVLRGVRAVTADNIEFKVFQERLIQIPPMGEQKKFAEFMIQTDKSKFISFKSQFIEMFGDTIENEKGWRTIPLLQTGKCKNGMNYSSKDCGVEMHCLGVADFQDNAVIDDMSVLPMVSLKERPNTDYLLQNGDIVFVRSNGNRALVGRSVVVYPGDEPVVYSGFCIRYRKEREELLTDYLLRFFKTDSVRAKMAGRGANIQNLNQQILAALNIPIPPIEMQKEFSVFVKQSDKSK